MRFRIAGLAPGLSLLIASLLSLTAAQCLVPIESVAHAAPGVEAAATSSINQIREEVGGEEIDLSIEAARVAPSNLSVSRTSSHSEIRQEPEPEIVMVPRPIHRRILPSSSDEVG